MTAPIDIRYSAATSETTTGAGAAAATVGVLVVEASPLVLPTVRESVAGLPGSWSVYGVHDPQEAARVLLAEPIDIAMVAIPPSLGAVAFLEWLRRRYPAVTRLAAFATRSSDEAIQAANVAHQSLGQIPTRLQLERVMGRSVTLRRRLESDQLTRFAGGLQRIPTIPTVYHEIRSLLASPDYSLSALADLIARDAGLSVKILQVINSAYYGLRRRISDLRQAVGLLGGSAIASLILGMTVHEQFVIRSSAKDAIAHEWPRALNVAKLARHIAVVEDFERNEVEASYLAGLLHNVGRLLFAANLPENYLDTPWPPRVAELLDLERSRLGAGHPELGAYVLGSWGLDDDLVAAVAFYAEPSEVAGIEAGPLLAVHSAAALSDPIFLPPDHAYLSRLGALDRWDVWEQAVAEGEVAG